MEHTEARIHDHSMKLDKAIEKIQLEVAYQDDEKELPKETNMAGFPTLMRLHLEP